MEEIRIGGRYRHFKGGEYRVLAVAKHSETQEEFVVYRSVKDNRVWVRPKLMFLAQSPDLPDFALTKSRRAGRAP